MFFAPGAVLLQENFAQGEGFRPPQKEFPGGCSRLELIDALLIQVIEEVYICFPKYTQ